MFIRSFLIIACCLPIGVACEDKSQATLSGFFNRYCVSCHGPDDQSGDRRFDAFPADVKNRNALADYQDVLDQLNLGEMPPADEAQPTDNERRAIVDLLTNRIAAYHRNHRIAAGKPLLRRLNSREYRNTVRDLFALNMTIFDPTAEFPRDQTEDHLDTIGETLVTSGYLLEQYLAAADAVINKAVYPLQKPDLQEWIFTDGFAQQPEIDQVHRKTNKFSWMTLYDVVGAERHEGAYGPILKFAEGVPLDGRYNIRLNAEGVNRDHPYDDDLIGTSRSEPFRLGIVPGNREFSKLHVPQPIEPLLADIPLTDERAWHDVDVWLDAGFTPRFTFRNGVMDARGLWKKVITRYPDQFPNTKTKGIVEMRFRAIRDGKIPQIRIHEIQIRGPIFDEWPTASHQAVFGSFAQQVIDSGTITRDQIEQQLPKVMAQAYRRAPSDAEVEHILNVIENQRQAGASAVDAYANGLKAVLCAPAFIYHEPVEQVDSKTAAETALANRLAYFLWSAPPDAELTRAAANGFTPQELRSQTTRMLKDARSQAFVEGFLGSWLTLNELGSQPPDRSSFRSYYRHNLGEAMQQETRLFTRHLLDENLGIDNFLDADFTFLNGPLATHYGLKPPAGYEFEKVTLTDRRRGGLLGHGSVLTVTANGIDTSPVVRGVWVLENILGTPPNPPPPDVEPLDPDVRGAKSIRDQLSKHRSNPACADCHRKIDPMGFALENFDPVGRWRTNYGRKTKIDASGELPNGATYDDVVSFKRLMLQRRELFARALTSKLLEYAVGRKMELEDRPQIDELTTALNKQGNGFRDLIHLCVQSPVFRGPSSIEE